MFGRRSPSAAPEVSPPKAGGKGRPTPRRTEAQKQRRQAAAPPKDRKSAARAARSERAKSLAALRAGDENALPMRDRGPVKRLVRDLVDARFNVAEFVLPVSFAVLALGLIWPGYPSIVFLAVMLGVIVDTVFLRLRVRRVVAARFPGEPTKGLAGYAMMRSLQFRRLRLPPPKVKRGAKL